MRVRQTLWGVKLALLAGGPAQAHVAQQSFVLLLPTETYTAAGVATVVATILALLIVPARAVDGLFAHRQIALPDLQGLRTLTSLLSLLALGFAVYVGFWGPRDPLSNLLPLGFWTLGWVALVSLSAVFGNLWLWLNPWSGVQRVLSLEAPAFRLPPWLGQWPAVALLVAFSAYLLAGIAPDDPAQLARLILAYWIATLAGIVLFGTAWVRQADLGYAVMQAYGTLAPARGGAGGAIGGPGWQTLAAPPGRAAGVFALTLLAAGSFDGVNETFWWLGVIGVNPLEFPGRSAVVWQTVGGLLATILGLALVFAATIRAGLRLSRCSQRFGRSYEWLALSLLPIALAYHIAHYLPSFLVAIQYCVAAINDPFATGLDWLGLEPFYVTTGFFNRIDSVRVIWLTQAGVVVIGHVWSILLSHAIALRVMPAPRRALLLTLPLSALMIAYTLLGLWLLAAPRGA